SSSFFDGVVGRYTPSLPEIALGVGGAASALLLTVLAIRVLPFLPESLSDATVNDTISTQAATVGT
ncbi:MAG: molybdopterin oxidoreductase, partial [Burkholderiales bacterium]|nr:molybdopterin oxidoreductase [Burkholderiales bacterium]